MRLGESAYAQLATLDWLVLILRGHAAADNGPQLIPGRSYQGKRRRFGVRRNFIVGV
jgi:hypothetical protein